MLGLMLKDLFNIKRQSKFYLLILVVYGLIASTSNDSYFLIGMIGVLCVMMPMTAMAYDEKTNWDVYALSMPINREMLVRSRYALGVIAIATGILVSSLFQILLIQAPLMEIVELSVICFVTFICMLSLILPIQFKYGVEKGRIGMMAILGSCALVIIGISKFADQFIEWNSIMSFINQYGLWMLMGFALVLFTSSYFISSKIYSKKEF